MTVRETPLYGNVKIERKTDSWSSVAVNLIENPSFEATYGSIKPNTFANPLMSNNTMGTDDWWTMNGRLLWDGTHLIAPSTTVLSSELNPLPSGQLRMAWKFQVTAGEEWGMSVYFFNSGLTYLSGRDLMWSVPSTGEEVEATYTFPTANVPSNAAYFQVQFRTISGNQVRMALREIIAVGTTPASTVSIPWSVCTPAISYTQSGGGSAQGYVLGTETSVVPGQIIRAAVDWSSTDSADAVLFGLGAYKDGVWEAAGSGDTAWGGSLDRWIGSSYSTDRSRRVKHFVVPPGVTKVRFSQYRNAGTGSISYTMTLHVLEPDLDVTYTGTPPAVGAPSNVDSSLSAPTVPGVASSSTVVQHLTKDGPISGTYAQRLRVATTAGLSIPVASLLPTTGETYTLLMYVRPKGRDLTFLPRIRGNNGPLMTAPANVWTEVRYTGEAGTGNAIQTGLTVLGSNGHSIGDLIDVDRALLTNGEYSGPYFDGSLTSLGDPEYRAVWTGYPHASASRLDRSRVEFIRHATNVSIRRGGVRRGLGIKTDVGLCTFMLHNDEDPLDGGTLDIGQKIQVTSNGNVIFTGLISDITATYPLDKSNGRERTAVQVTVSDAVMIHGGTMRYGVQIAEGFETFESRINRLASGAQAPIEAPTQGAPREVYAL